MQKKSFHKPTARPTKWPAVFHFSRTEPGGAKFQFDILINDEEAWGALLLNVKNFPAVALKAKVGENDYSDTGLSIEDLRTIDLVAGAEFREPTKREADGERADCTVCTKTFQPLKFPRHNRFVEQDEEAGNYADFKTDRLVALKAKMPEVYAEAEQLTVRLLEGQKTPEKLVILLVCPDCTTQLFDIGWKFSGFSKAVIVDQVLQRDINIKSAIRRNQVLEALGGKRKEGGGERLKEGQGRDGRPQGHDNRGFREGREHPGKVNFHGANYFQATGEVLQTIEAEGKIPKGQELEFVVGLSNERMVELKIIEDVGRTSQADQIRRLAQYGLDNQKDLREFNRKYGGKGSTPLGEIKGKEVLEVAPVAVAPVGGKPKLVAKAKKPVVAATHRSSARRPAKAKKAKAKMAIANKR